MFQKNHVKQAELLLEKIKDADITSFIRMMHTFKNTLESSTKKYGYIGVFNGFYHRYPSPEAHWTF